MSKRKGCPAGKVRAVDGKCYPGIKGGPWTIVESVGDLNIYKGMPKLENHRGTISSGEKKWHPPSIQVSQDNMSQMTESNTIIFFDDKDLKNKNYENRDIYFARKK